MTPILFVASDLVPGSPARHLARIADGLDPSRFKVEIAVLNRTSARVEIDVPVHDVPLRSEWDWTGLRKLKRVAAELKPAIVHAWGPAAVRATSSITAPRTETGHVPRLVVSDASFASGSWKDWWMRRRLRSCDRVVAATWVEAERYRGLGVLADRLTRIAPGVEAPPPPDRAAILRSLDIPANGRFIVASGKLEHDAGMKYAIWAFDLVRLEYPDLHLAILGDGPARDSLVAYARATMYDDLRVRFAGHRADGGAIIAAADFAWVVHPRGEPRFALEAMAAGVPLFSWRLPEMAEVIDDDGVLADAEQPAQLASKTYPFISDRTSRIALGDRGRAAILERFSASRELEHFESLYTELV